MYTMVPNALIEAIPNMTGSVIAVCMAVCRKTLGHHRVWDKISTAQFEQMTGMSNRSVIDAVETAVANGWMIRKRDGNSYQYKVHGAEEILNREKTSHIKIDNPGHNAMPMCEESSQSYEESSQSDYEKSSYTKEIYTLPNGSVAAQPLADSFRRLHEELKSAKNRGAKLREIYILCFGEATAPGYGYLQKVANQIGGAGYMAMRFWELSARPPTGDVLAYLLEEHKQKKGRAYTNGKAQEVDLTYLLNGANQ